MAVLCSGVGVSEENELEPFSVFTATSTLTVMKFLAVELKHNRDCRGKGAMIWPSVI